MPDSSDPKVADSPHRREDSAEIFDPFAPPEVDTRPPRNRDDRARMAYDPVRSFKGIGGFLIIVGLSIAATIVVTGSEGRLRDFDPAFAVPVAVLVAVNVVFGVRLVCLDWRARRVACGVLVVDAGLLLGLAVFGGYVVMGFAMLVVLGLAFHLVFDPEVRQAAAEARSGRPS